MAVENNLQKSIKYPTSLILRGADPLGTEIARSLLEQGGFVVIVDHENEYTHKQLAELADYELLTVIDYASLATLEEELRRLDYVFFLAHKTSDLTDKISTQEFLQSSNYLDAILDLSAKFESKFLLTTSIKAHQMSLAQNDFDVNFGTSTKESHTVYTGLEIQRYAESLVKEYEEKVGIDTRIIRLGEVLGKGMDITSDSPHIKLMISALEGEGLTIPGDGLEVEYFVHSLDAAYGILKAQFSLNTKGKIYTLANEDEITLLSFAYKLQELELGSKEIQFTNDKHNLPPIKLYKPAHFLSTIGWKPRINLERAIALSLEYIKEVLSMPVLESPLPAPEEVRTHSKSILARIRDFFLVAEHIPQEPQKEEQLESALGRLIQERKTQENARKGSIVLANNKLRDRLKPERKLNTFQKLNLFINDQFYKLKKRFLFLKNITLTDFVFITVGAIAFIIVYFVVISPAVCLLRDVYYIDDNLKKFNTALSQFDLPKAREANAGLKSQLSSVQLRVNELRFIFELAGKKELYSDLQNFLSDSVQLTTGYEEVFLAMEPVTEYVSVFKPELLYRFSDTNILTSNSTQDFSDELAQVEDNNNLINIGVDRINKTQTDLMSNLDKLPDWIKQRYTSQIAIINDAKPDFVSFKDVYPFLPRLLGSESKTSVMLLVQDNSRYSAAGGAIAGYILFDIDKGAISNLVVKSIGTNNNSLVNPSERVVKEINLLSNRIVSGSVTYDDLALIGDKDLLLDTLQSVIGQKEGREIDFTVSLNINTLEAFIREIGSVDYSQINFNSSNLLANINLLMGDNKVAANRNETIMNLFAKVIENQGNRFNQMFPVMLRTLASDRVEGNVHLYSRVIEFSNYISILNGRTDQGTEQVSFGINSDPKNVVINKYPVMTVAMDFKVNSDLTQTRSIELSASGAESLQNIYVCNPSGSKNFRFEEVKAELVTNNFATNKVCSIFQADEDLKYRVIMDALPFDNREVNGYNYVVEVLTNPGIKANFDIQFGFASNLNVTPEDNSFVKQNDKYVYSGVFEGSKFFRFNIK